MPRLIGVAILAGCLAACGSHDSRPVIVTHVDRDSDLYGSVDIAGLSDRMMREIREADFEETDWASFFAVYTVDSDGPGGRLPPMIGAYFVEPPVIRFRTRYPFVPGVSYRVHFDPDVLESRLAIGDVLATGDLDTVFALPVQASSALTPTTSVTAIYPSADQLPANQLKFYVHFSAPMAEGLAYSNVRLIDERTNEPMPAPFLELEPELWDPSRQRFTILFNPGRVKREVGPNIELGPPVRPGRTYRLEINRSWLDAGGRPLRDDYTKTFQAIEADRSALDIERWVIDTPQTGSRHPVVVNFGEPLDHALLMRVIDVVGPDGTPLDGIVGTGDEERKWRFTPVKPWQRGRYELRVETILEDLAGNTLRGPFDVDVRQSQPSEVREAEQVRLIRFRISG